VRILILALLLVTSCVSVRVEVQLDCDTVHAGYAVTPETGMLEASD